jgi:hypothetical protein
VYLLEAEKKFMIHLKAFLFKLDHVLLLKYMYIFVIFESKFTAHDLKPVCEFCLMSYFSEGNYRHN